MSEVAQETQAFVEAAGMTNVGLARTGNEDAFLIATLQRSLVVQNASAAAKNEGARDSLAGTLLIVADGMGGEGGGDIASRVAVETVASYLLDALPRAPPVVVPAGEGTATSVQAQLFSAILAGDSRVKEAARHSSTPRMGTTLTLALVLWPSLYVAHVGDTRCYLLREGQFSRLTTDHTMAQKLIDEAVPPVESDSPLHDVLWNSLGGAEQRPDPQLVELELKLGDRLLLCTDGLTKHVSDPEILLALSAQEPNATQCARLIELANAGGGSDNVTVLVANVLSSAPTTHSA